MTDVARLRERRPAPEDLSKWAVGVWNELTADNDFNPHEYVAFTRALTWWDVSDTLLAEAAALAGRERDARLKAAGDAATSALRHWRTLKFTDASTRRPGRPSGVDWSKARKAAAEAGAR
jgi:hypothetical protein